MTKEDKMIVYAKTGKTLVIAGKEKNLGEIQLRGKLSLGDVNVLAKDERGLTLLISVRVSDD